MLKRAEGPLWNTLQRAKVEMEMITESKSKGRRGRRAEEGEVYWAHYEASE